MRYRLMMRLCCVGILLSMLLGFSGCLKEKKSVLLINSDFEELEGWISPLPDFLTTERAHSGQYSYRMAAGAQYSPAYTTTLEVAGSAAPRTLRLGGWVYLPSGNIGSTLFVVTVNCQGRRPDIWNAIKIDQTVKRYQVWVPIQKYIHLPKDLQPTDVVTFYIWHNDFGSERLYLDDLTLEAW